MPADHVTIETPKHALPALTTAELSKYRRDLEKAIAKIAEDAPVQVTLQKRLDAVLAEQEDRERIVHES